jgi:hypothetical protein
VIAHHQAFLTVFLGFFQKIVLSLRCVKTQSKMNITHRKVGLLWAEMPD